MIKYYFRTDGFTVRETPEGLTVQCIQCGERFQYLLAARVGSIEAELNKHRAGCVARDAISLSQLAYWNRLFHRGRHER
jgi:hypothetical protein